MASNFANPLGVIQTALADQAGQKPFLMSDFNLKRAQTSNLNQDAALTQQQAAGVGQLNTIRQRQIEDDAATREAIKNAMTPVPVTAPAPTLPPPPIDPTTGKPVITPDYKAAQASSAMQVPDLDVGAAALTLMKQGRFDAANTLIKSHDAQVKSRNENTGKELDNFTAQVAARKDALSGIFEAMYPDGPDKPRSPEGVAKAAQMWDANRDTLLKLGMNPAVVNAPFDADRADAQYRSLAGAAGITGSIKDHLGIAKTKTDTEEAAARTALYTSQTKEAATKQEAEQIDLDWLKKQNAQASQSPQDLQNVVGGFIDPKKYPDLFNRTIKEYEAVMTTAKPSERRKAALEVLTKAKDKVDELESATDPKRLNFDKQRAYGVARETAQAQADMLNPDDFAPAVANYQVKLSDLLARAPGASRQKILAAVLKQNPNFQESNFDNYNSTEKGFSAGRQGDMVRSNNNVLEHLGMLEEAGRALNNGQLPVLNRIANQLGFQVGGDAKASYDVIAHFVGDEVNKALVPGAGGQAERAQQVGHFSSDLNDAQRAANIKAAVGILDAQQQNLKKQYDRGTYGRGKQELYTPEALATRDRLLGNAGAGGHVIAIGNKQYRYNGTGDTADLKNYTEIAPK